MLFKIRFTPIKYFTKFQVDYILYTEVRYLAQTEMNDCLVILDRHAMKDPNRL